MRKPEHLDEEDGKLNICLACNNALAGTLGQDLILCECCPAAFHAQCAGYGEKVSRFQYFCFVSNRDSAQVWLKHCWAVPLSGRVVDSLGLIKINELTYKIKPNCTL